MDADADADEVGKRRSSDNNTSYRVSAGGEIRFPRPVGQSSVKTDSDDVSETRIAIIVNDITSCLLGGRSSPVATSGAHATLGIRVNIYYDVATSCDEDGCLHCSSLLAFQAFWNIGLGTVGRGTLPRFTCGDQTTALRVQMMNIPDCRLQSPASRW